MIAKEKHHDGNILYYSLKVDGNLYYLHGINFSFIIKEKFIAKEKRIIIKEKNLELKNRYKTSYDI